MERGLGNLRLRWNVLRVVAAAIAIATFAVTLATIPLAIWILWVLALLIGTAVSTVALV
ncbi:MAG: hypothetical protein ACLP5V_02660 [Candidatus Bathyarchaeia archaeon]